MSAAGWTVQQWCLQASFIPFKAKQRGGMSLILNNLRVCAICLGTDIFLKGGILHDS